MNIFIVFLLVIILHEIGHIIPYIVFTKKFPKISITWNMISVGTMKDIYSLTVFQYVTILLTGISLGFLPLTYVSHTLFYPAVLVYSLFSSIDLYNLITVTSNPSNFLYLDEFYINLNNKNISKIKKLSSKKILRD